MKKKYITGLVALLISVTVLAQNEVVFDFETEQDLLGWVEAGGQIGSASITSEGIAIEWDGTGTTNRKPRIKTTNANVDASTQKYIEVTLINNSSQVSRVRVMHFKGNDPSGDPTSAAGADTRYTSFDIATNTASTTYTLDLTNAGWINYNATTNDDTDNDMDHIWLQLVTSPSNGALTTNSATDGNVIIQKVKFTSSLPSTPRTEYTFDDTSDAEGFVGQNGVTLSQTTVGEIELSITDASPFPKFEQQAGNYNVDADTYKYCRITLRNDSDKDKMSFVSPSGGNQFKPVDITPNNPNSVIYEINLNQTVDTNDNPVFTNWTGTQDTWALQLVENNPEGGNPIPSAGTIIIEEISFYSFSLSENDVVNPEINLYPNPVTDYLHIASLTPVKSITLYNVMGQLIKSQKGFNQTIDLTTISSGTYMIEIDLDNGMRAMKKFIKK